MRTEKQLLIAELRECCNGLDLRKIKLKVKIFKEDRKIFKHFLKFLLMKMKVLLNRPKQDNWYLQCFLKFSNKKLKLDIPINWEICIDCLKRSDLNLVNMHRKTPENKSTYWEFNNQWKQKRWLDPAMANIDVFCQEKACMHEDKMARYGKNFPVINWLSAFYGCAYCRSKNISVKESILIESDPERIENLRFVIDQLNNEIDRYRDYEWKLVSWSIAFSFGLLTADATLRRLLAQQSLFQLMFDVMTIMLITFSGMMFVAHLLFVHGELTTNRNWRRNAERNMGLYSDKSILPKKWKNQVAQFKQGRDTFIIPFCLLVLIISFSCAYAVSHYQPIPTWIGDGITAMIWIWFTPFIIVVLSLLLFGYIIVAMFAQGLFKRGPF